MKILVVDDISNILKIVVRRLTDLGHKAVPVLWEGTWSLKDKQIEDCDLILSDIGLGLDDGVALATRLRKRWKDKPIMLMSANPFNRSRAKAAGFNFTEKEDIGVKWPQRAES